MPQECLVLKCVSCEMYQVHQLKKITKWQCKVCNQKQSQKQCFYRGSAVNCRKMVQTLNLQEEVEVKVTEELNLAIDSNTMNDSHSSDFRSNYVLENSDVATDHLESSVKKTASKWAKFMENDEHFGVNEDSSSLSNAAEANFDTGHNEFMVFLEERSEKSFSKLDEILERNLNPSNGCSRETALQLQSSSSEERFISANQFGDAKTEHDVFMSFKQERRGLKRKSDHMFEPNFGADKKWSTKAATDVDLGEEQIAANLYEDHPFCAFNERESVDVIKEPADQIVTPTSKWFKYLE